MAANAIDGSGGDVHGRFPAGCCAVVATDAIRRCSECAVVDLRANPCGSFMASTAIGGGGKVITRLS